MFMSKKDLGNVPNVNYVGGLSRDFLVENPLHTCNLRFGIWYRFDVDFLPYFLIAFDDV